MTKKNPARRGVALLALALTALAAPAGAADWKPDHAVTVIVPYAPGGGTDTQARAVAKELARIWAQPVIVENVGGADGLIGSRRAMDAKPTGYTLLVQIPSIALIKNTPSFKGIDPLAQLVPVSAFSSLPGVMVENASMPPRSMKEMVAYCRAAAKPCAYGTTENMARLMGQMLATDSALPTLIIANYKGGGQLISDLVANNINLALMGLTAAQPHQRSGAVRILMTLGAQRSPVLPEVPTAREAGFPAFEWNNWYGFFAPKGTPPEIVKSIAAAVHEAVKGDDPKKLFATLGAEPLGNTPAEFGAMVKQEVERVDALAKRFPLE